VDEPTERQEKDGLILELLERIEARLDLHEQMMAQLLAAHTELWSGLEALTEATMDGRPAEDRAKFAQAVAQYSTELWSAIHDRNPGLDRDPEAPPGTVGDPPS
jgi:hypothetical protein